MIWKGDREKRLPQRAMTDEEKLIQLHNRLGHVFVKKLIDGFMSMKFAGYTIPRSMLGVKALSKLHKCSSCYLCKMRRKSFHATGELVSKFAAGECICFDFHVFVNMPGFDSTKYRANFTDPSSGATLSYGVESKNQILECLKLVLQSLELWFYIEIFVFRSRKSSRFSRRERLAIKT